ncbi:hypothetical protein ZWY2020_058951 [Hordeum vulgare]|nr:hypothetical protein ZWY2020_058951 [Hordeum vulgare]
MRTASVCTTSAMRGMHTFKIIVYSLQRGLGVSKIIPSAAFDHAFIFLALVSEDAEVRAFFEIRKGAEVRVFFEIRLVDQTNKLPPSVVLS